MTNETGDSGLTGFGYGNPGTFSQDNQQEANARGRAGNGSGPGPGHGAASAADSEAEEVKSDFGYDHVPGFETSASNCVNRARQIARSLNHATCSSDHLMLALTMDQNARRLVERVGDVTQLRAIAMRKLGMVADQSPTPTSDLADIGKKAREAADEREQLVSISDLIRLSQGEWPLDVWSRRELAIAGRARYA